MASLTLAALCSAATYREGLLSVLEAGLERFNPDGYPAIVIPQLVVRIDWDPSDFGSVRFTLSGPSSNTKTATLCVKLR